MEETIQINQKLKQQQSKQFENELNRFFADLLRNVDAIRKIFQEDEKYLEEHPTMKQLKKLIDQEIKASRKIKD